MNGFDISLFLALNGDGGSFTDWLMHLISGRLTWVPLYILILWAIQHKYGWRYMWIMLLFIIAGVALCDQTCNLLKNGMQFLRPTHTPSLEGLVHTVNNYKGGLYGTASAHAANSLVIIIISTAAIHGRLYIATMSLWLAAVCYSRIYLGVHFPSQIILGLATGFLFGWILKYIFIKYVRPRIKPKNHQTSC